VLSLVDEAPAALQPACEQALRPEACLPKRVLVRPYTPKFKNGNKFCLSTDEIGWWDPD